MSWPNLRDSYRGQLEQRQTLLTRAREVFEQLHVSDTPAEGSLAAKVASLPARAATQRTQIRASLDALERQLLAAQTPRRLAETLDTIPSSMDAIAATLEQVRTQIADVEARTPAVQQDVDALQHAIEHNALLPTDAAIRQHLLDSMAAFTQRLQTADTVAAVDAVSSDAAALRERQTLLVERLNELADFDAEVSTQLAGQPVASAFTTWSQQRREGLLQLTPLGIAQTEGVRQLSAWIAGRRASIQEMHGLSDRITTLTGRLTTLRQSLPARAQPRLSEFEASAASLARQLNADQGLLTLREQTVPAVRVSLNAVTHGLNALQAQTGEVEQAVATQRAPLEWIGQAIQELPPAFSVWRQRLQAESHRWFLELWYLEPDSGYLARWLGQQPQVQADPGMLELLERFSGRIFSSLPIHPENPEKGFGAFLMRLIFHWEVSKR